VTGILSLVVNTILIAVLLVMYNMLGQLQGLQGTASNIGASVLGGMYTNFEKMDRATIKTVIPVDAQIPLDINVPVQTTTQITLAEAVNIPNAQVVIATGGLNINSNARVTLPAGTPLMVNLDFNLPVQTTIPVHLEVPVNIPMANTELHEPFVGLQRVVQPWYCMVEPNAFSLNGQAICR
jgi:Ni,Fe-hydrogenase III small subunit